MGLTQSTQDEIKFIRGLGSHGLGENKGMYKNRKELLGKYVSAAKRRHDWGNIDKKAVMKFARLSLSRCR